ncbi:MAG: AcrB/AcrD/AcrF family protein, partial [Candidatus Zixiibacteriota bacterium]
MTLSEFGLKNRYTVYVLAIAAVFFGVVAYFSLPIQLFPETAPPLVNILTAYPGASAEDAADMVSDPIEKECAALEGVYKVSSSSQDGMSVVTVEFRYDVDVDMAALDVQNAISRIRGKLPSGIQEPQVLKFSTSNRPVLTVGIIGDDLVEVRRLVEEDLAPELQRVAGVAMVDVFGGHNPEVSVFVDRSKLDAYKLPIAAVAQAIKEHNVSIPAGKINSNEIQYSFRVDEESKTIQDIAKIPIRLQDGNRLLLGDLAKIRYGSAEDLSKYHVNGESAIAVQILKQDNANTVDVVLRAQAKFAEIAGRYPQLRFVEAEESASFTQQVVSNMLGSVAQALFLAAIVIFLFLGSFRRGLVVAVSMPMSFLLTFAGMKMFGIQIDLVTLTAVILSVGMVVDASVVILENIARRYHADKLTPEEAARVGASEIQFAIIAGNATTLTVLIPLLFLYGFVGKTFGPLAATLIIAFLSSLLVALIMVPILTTFTAGEGGRFERLSRKISDPWNFLMNRIRGSYLFLLRHALSRRWIVFMSAAVLLVVGVLLLRFQGTELLPKMDGGTSFVTVETTSGTSLSQTEEIIRQVEKIILNEPEVLLISTQLGFEPGMHSFGGGGVQGPTQGYISITLSPRTERDETIWEIQDRIREKLSRIPGIENLVVRESGSTARSTTASSIVVSIQGDDPLVLDRLGDQVLAAITEVPSVVNPYRSWRRDQRTVSLNINKERALELGMIPLSIAQELV